MNGLFNVINEILLIKGENLRVFYFLFIFYFKPFFAVLQLCYNRLTGSVPTQLGHLKKLNVLALQYNQLAGAIPASLGELGSLTRLDLSYNSLFSSIPAKLADAPMLEVLDIRNNSLSGNVPPGNMVSPPRSLILVFVTLLKDPGGKNFNLFDSFFGGL